MCSIDKFTTLVEKTYEKRCLFEFKEEKNLVIIIIVIKLNYGFEKSSFYF